MISTLDGPNLIYVAGYGRSGSTLLDTLLGNHPRIFGAGEVTWLFQMSRDRGACSCGLRLQDCPVWGAVLEGVRQTVPRSEFHDAAEITEYSEGLAGSRQRAPEYGRLWRATFQHLQRVTGKPTVIDSSKSCRRTIRRFSLLTKFVSSTCCLVHLVRNPIAVSNSAARGSNRMLELGKTASRPGGPLRALAGWCMANAAAGLQRSVCSDRVMRVRYESLIGDPKFTLQRLGERLQFNLTPVIRKIEAGVELAPGHGIAGNRMRRAGPIFFESDNARLPAFARGDQSR